MPPLMVFHALKTPDNPEEFLKAAVYLTEKLYRKNQGAHLILLCDPEDLSLFDDFLWTLIPESFLPHQTEDHKASLSLPTVIDLISKPENIPLERDIPNILINVSQILPSSIHTFSEIHQLVGKNTAYREFCRTLFRDYKKNGIPIQSEAITL